MFVRGFDSRRNLLENRESSLNVQGSLASKQIVQSFAVYIFHHQIEYSLSCFAEIGNTNHVGMLYRRCRSCFALKARNRLALLQVVTIQQFRANGFNGYLSGLKVLIDREIHLTHRTPAKTLLNCVAICKNKSAR
jgi:hypothetical protein